MAFATLITLIALSVNLLYLWLVTKAIKSRRFLPSSYETDQDPKPYWLSDVSIFITTYAIGVVGGIFGWWSLRKCDPWIIMAIIALLPPVTEFLKMIPTHPYKTINYFTGWEADENGIHRIKNQSIRFRPNSYYLIKRVHYYPGSAKQNLKSSPGESIRVYVKVTAREDTPIQQYSDFEKSVFDSFQVKINSLEWELKTDYANIDPKIVVEQLANRLYDFTQSFEYVDVWVGKVQLLTITTWRNKSKCGNVEDESEEFSSENSELLES